jgi:hypothetical protein
MNTEQAIILTALEIFAEDYLNKHIQQTQDSVRVFSEDEEMRATYQRELAERIELKNYAHNLIGQLNGTGYLIVDRHTPENQRLLWALENL